MCVAALAWNAHPRWRLVVAGNRDEFHGRPTAVLSAWAESDILAGRDLQAGGTWLGVSPNRFALVTNHRAEGYPRPELATRGALVSDWLRGTAPGRASRDGAAMNPFNLWLASPEQLLFVTNHPRAEGLALSDGVHGLSNGPRAERWFKTAQLEAALGAWLAAGEEPDVLLAVLADETPDPADPNNRFSPVFIRHPDYGTRCSTVIAVDVDGAGTIIERSFDANGAETETVSLGFDWG